MSIDVPPNVSAAISTMMAACAEMFRAARGTRRVTRSTIDDAHLQLNNLNRGPGLLFCFGRIAQIRLRCEKPLKVKLNGGAV